MEGVLALRELIEPNDWICKIDLKEAYVVVPIHENSRPYLTFQNRGIVYQYRSLAFGLSVAPRVFSKLMRFAIEPLRKQGIRLVYYLDDICLLARSKKEMEETCLKVTRHLELLGFIINYQKSILEPSHSQEFLGFLFNTKTMQIQVPTKKIQKLKTRIAQIQQSTSRKSCRWIASLLGKITSMIPAIGEVLLHIRYLQRDLARCLKVFHNNWEAKCRLDWTAVIVIRFRYSRGNVDRDNRAELAIAEISRLSMNVHFTSCVDTTSMVKLSWWTSWIEQKNGLAIRKDQTETPATTIFVDASDSGWGIHSPQVQTCGFWTQLEQQTSINVRELQTIVFAIQLHAERFQGSTIRIYSDSLTALKYVKKSGGTASEYLQELAVQVQDLCNKFSLNIQYHHIPGIQNTNADKLSRQKIPLYEWTLPTRWFRYLQKKWGKSRMKIDAFAARHNHRLPTYWSLRPDPQAGAQDAFQQEWPSKGLYLNPPWKEIPQVIRKLVQWVKKL
ncbi:hypothetical protein G6F37_011883 [Rhizopus arrhizus]|nr:hypothetical protein G6F38_011886 [Rhizopus arrhizus]KAG1146853.1 hypothetical protein G6F37_011883 [Rhizopus arrhizus]